MSYQLAERESGMGDVARGGDDAFASVVGNSPSILATLDLARRFAARRGPTILITGETGTGKELFARGIHYAGPDPDTPFVAVNCPAIPPQLLESELFGYERGAFTDAKSQKPGLFEVAGAGTLFLDEVSSLPLSLQPKLLRALEERRVRRVGGYEEIDIRCSVIAATNEPLPGLVADGRFREDLYYRLHVLRLDIPPLREREEDVSVLAQYLVSATADAHGLPAPELTGAALDRLREHPWPGNVRELKNVIQRAVLLCDAPAIGPEHLTFLERSRSARAPDSGRSIPIPAGGRTLASVEEEAVRHTLEITGWNRSAASRILEISRPTLLRKIRRYEIRPEGGGGA